MSKKTKKQKIKVKEKIALAVFMESIPKIMEIWHEKHPEMTFEEFCLSTYEAGKALKNKEKGETCHDSSS